MIHGLSKHTVGAGAALAYFLDEEFLDKETKQWRKREPDPKLLDGDPQQIEEMCDGSKYKHKYTSGVLSFTAEESQKIEATPGMKEALIEELRIFAYAGFKHRDAKMLCVVQHTHLNRLELHYLIPRVSAESGLYFNPFPPNYDGRQGQGSNNTFKKQNDAFVDYICKKYELQNPRSLDVKREVKEPAFEDSRITRLRAKVIDQINTRIDSGELNSREDIFKFLEKYKGEITRSGNDYFSVKFPVSEKAVRLKGGIYGANSASAIELLRSKNVQKELSYEEISSTYRDVMVERSEQVEKRHGKRAAENDECSHNSDLQSELDDSFELLSGEYHEIDSKASAAAASYIKENKDVLLPSAPAQPFAGGASVGTSIDSVTAGSTGNKVLDEMFAQYLSWKKALLKKEASNISQSPVFKQARLSTLRARSHSIDLKMSVITSHNFVEPGKGALTKKDADIYKRAIAKEVRVANKEMKEAERLDQQRLELELIARNAQEEKSRENQKRQALVEQALKELRQKLEKERYTQQQRTQNGPAPKK